LAAITACDSALHQRLATMRVSDYREFLRLVAALESEIAAASIQGRRRPLRLAASSLRMQVTLELDPQDAHYVIIQIVIAPEPPPSRRRESSAELAAQATATIIVRDCAILWADVAKPTDSGARALAALTPQCGGSIRGASPLIRSKKAPAPGITPSIPASCTLKIDEESLADCALFRVGENPRDPHAAFPPSPPAKAGDGVTE